MALHFWLASRCRRPCCPPVQTIRFKVVLYPPHYSPAAPRTAPPAFQRAYRCRDPERENHRYSSHESWAKPAGGAARGSSTAKRAILRGESRSPGPAARHAVAARRNAAVPPGEAGLMALEIDLV